MPIPMYLVPRKAPQRGISLIIVLIMLVIIGITAATSMRAASSEQRASNNIRMQDTAQQYAEAALRYCEGQVQAADAVRVATLKTAVIPTTTFALSGWEDALSWSSNGGGRASATLTQIQSTQISDAATTAPTKLPECVVEYQTMGSPTFTMTVITARGFSPDYAADANGQTIQGAVVWLQSIVNAL